MSDSSSSISLPQLAFILILSGLVIRYFFRPSASAPNTFPGARGARSSGARQRVVNVQHVEQIASMFPQLDRRAIAWDLQRNGGSVAATSERVLAAMGGGGPGLDVPPPSFQPAFLATPPAAASSTRRTPPQAIPEPAHKSLIERYNLSSKVSEPNPSSSSPSDEAESSGAQSTPGKGKGVWAGNKNDRAALLAKRREEMILSARRKMEEKDRAAKQDINP